MASVKVQVQISDALREKLSELNNPTTMLAIHNTLAKMCDPYVPFLTGALAQTNVITDKYVRYIQPYARRQYYGDDFNHTIEFHPLASARWDEAMMRDHGEEFVTQVEDILKWRLMQNGGR